MPLCISGIERDCPRKIVNRDLGPLCISGDQPQQMPRGCIGGIDSNYLSTNTLSFTNSSSLEQSDRGLNRFRNHMHGTTIHFLSFPHDVPAAPAVKSSTVTAIG